MQALHFSALFLSLDITSTIARGPESQSVSEGDDVHFLCLHSDSLPAANLYWTHNSQEIFPGDSPRLRVSTSVLSSTQVTSTLSISAVELNDAGQYVCLAINPVLLGSAVESAPATLTVQGERVGQGVSRALCSLLLCLPPLAVPKAPSFTAGPSSLILPFPGGTATFACSSAGYPPPSVDWLHNGVPITAGTRVSVTMVGAESQLRVVNVVEADTGSYQCVANNSLGQVNSQTASLTIASEFVGGLVVRPPTAIQPPPPAPSLLPLPLQALVQILFSLHQTLKPSCHLMLQFPVVLRQAHPQPTCLGLRASPSSTPNASRLPLTTASSFAVFSWRMLESTTAWPQTLFPWHQELAGPQ